jgi:hypothetical protein
MKGVLAQSLLACLLVAGSHGQATQQAQQQPTQQTQTNHATSQRPHYYTNSDGQRVKSPVQAPSAPAGATARCRDGSWSSSKHRQGTCSHHGGVASWLVH